MRFLRQHILRADAIFSHQKKEKVVVLKKSFVVVLALCCLAQIASADDVGLTKQFSACMDKSGGVTVNMLDCIGEETKRQDTRLNKAYKEVTTQLSPARKRQLQDVFSVLG